MTQNYVSPRNLEKVLNHLATPHLISGCPVVTRPNLRALFVDALRGSVPQVGQPADQRFLIAVYVVGHSAIRTCHINTSSICDGSTWQLGCCSLFCLTTQAAWVSSTLFVCAQIMGSFDAAAAEKAKVASGQTLSSLFSAPAGRTPALGPKRKLDQISSASDDTSFSFGFAL